MRYDKLEFAELRNVKNFSVEKWQAHAKQCLPGVRLGRSSGGMPKSAAAVAGSGNPAAAFNCCNRANSVSCCCCCCFKLEEEVAEDVARAGAGELGTTGFGRVNSRFAAFSSEYFESVFVGGSSLERGSTNFSAVLISFSAWSKMSFCFESLEPRSTEDLRPCDVVLTSPASLVTSLFLDDSSSCWRRAW